LTSKLFVKNCSQTAADEDTVIIDSSQEVVIALFNVAITDPLRHII